MATEDIVIRYKADVSELENDLNKVIQSQNQIATTTKQTSQEVQKSINVQAQAQQKRLQGLKLDVDRLRQIREENKKAFDTTAVNNYGKEVNEAANKLDKLDKKTRETGQSTQQTFNELKGTIQNVAGAFGVAFGLDAIVNFSKKSVEAFIQAERNVKLLESAIVDLGGESVQSFEALSQQAELLGANTLESDDNIRRASVTLKNYGLSASQIGQILPGLIGLAKRTGDSLDSLASKIGNALEGTGRQFKNLGANISTNKTQLENYNELLRALADSSSQATLDSTDLTNALILQQKQVEQLEEDIGGKLAPAWTRVYQGALQYAATLLNLPTGGKALAADNLADIEAETKARVDQLKAEGKTVEDIVGDLTVELANAQRELTIASAESKQTVENYGGIFNTLRKIVDLNFQRNAGIDLALAQSSEETAKGRIASIQQQIDFQKDQQRLDQETIKLEELKKKKTSELQKLLEENQKKNDVAAQTNVTNIEDELKAREEAEKKAREEIKKTAEARKQLLEQLKAELVQINRAAETQKISSIDPKTFDEAVDKINQLRDLNKRFVDEDIDLKIAQAKAQNLYTKEVKDLFEQIRKGRKDALDVKGGEEILALETATIEKLAKLKEEARRLTVDSAIGDITTRIEEEGQKLQDITDKIAQGIGIGQNKIYKEQLDERLLLFSKLVEQEKNLKIQEVKDQLKFDLQSVKDSSTAAAEKQVIRQKAQEKINEITKNAEKQFKQAEQTYDDATSKLQSGVLEFVSANAQALQQVGAILTELGNLYDAFAEKRIETIEEEKNARLTAIDEQLAKDQEALELRRISEEEAYLRKKSLEEQKVKLEEEAAKKVREIKKKQAILDKANALFQIALNTAQALADVKNLTTAGALTPLILALAGLQAAAVIAQPIPYKKGSKDTGARGHMARVGEEGEEIVYMPSHSKVLPAKQTNRYGELLDAMFDNKLNQYIAKTYVSPALERQRREFDNQKQETFANNITKSLYFNGGLNANEMDRIRRKGQPITNVDEIAKAIASNLPVYDSYRR